MGAKQGGDVDLNPFDVTIAKGGGSVPRDLEDDSFMATPIPKASVNHHQKASSACLDDDGPNGEQTFTIGEGSRLLVPAKSFPKKAGLPKPSVHQRDNSVNGTDDEKWGGQEEIPQDWNEEFLEPEVPVRHGVPVRSRNDPYSIGDGRNRLSLARASMIPAPMKVDRTSLARRQSLSSAGTSRALELNVPRLSASSSVRGSRVSTSMKENSAKPGMSVAQGTTRDGAQKSLALHTGVANRSRRSPSPASKTRQNLRTRAPSVENFRPRSLTAKRPSTESISSEVSETPSGQSTAMSRVPLSESGRDNAMRRSQPAMSEQVDRKKSCIDRKQSVGAFDRKLSMGPGRTGLPKDVPSRVNNTKVALSRTIGCPTGDSHWQKRKDYNPQKAIEDSLAGRPPSSGRSSKIGARNNNNTDSSEVGRGDSNELKLFDAERRLTNISVPGLRASIQSSSSLRTPINARFNGAAASKLRNNISTSYLQITPGERPGRGGATGGEQNTAQRSQMNKVKAARTGVSRGVSNVGSSTRERIATRGALKSCLKVTETRQSDRDSVTSEGSTASVGVVETPSVGSSHDSLELPAWAHQVGLLIVDY